MLSVLDSPSAAERSKAAGQLMTTWRVGGRSPEGIGWHQTLVGFPPSDAGRISHGGDVSGRIHVSTAEPFGASCSPAKSAKFCKSQLRPSARSSIVLFGASSKFRNLICAFDSPIDYWPAKRRPPAT